MTRESRNGFPFPVYFIERMSASAGDGAPGAVFPRNQFEFGKTSIFPLFPLCLPSSKGVFLRFSLEIGKDDFLRIFFL